MDLHLQGRVAVVTGASRGIGLAVTRALLDEGAQVVAAARASSAELDGLAKSGALKIVEVDLAEPLGPARLVGAAGDRIDILVNNVGRADVRTGGFLSVTDGQWQTSFVLNMLPPVRSTRTAMP